MKLAWLSPAWTSPASLSKGSHEKQIFTLHVVG